ncbi:hypothetical protein [Heyndrickxia ginsengihumi]|uniref:Uncharacterized protein n=1 Tax=Heyndrickxia ginsengihumi TaxID=363870 RepID=A0A0A6VGV9_9BACI|nr:hypothetical protein [Heyndrickxia ginsengihumi]KHD86683.1 hypothetical protein NG54_01030 [Heyndrickxia ginsengihumi]MBE6184672.1 hypothetical protein [Bacillus sp. (in: firmicutes)]NEY18376.1 hypothetical protein [Heyndrickxia ginsengihumi]
MKLFIEYILDEIDLIGTANGYRVSLSATKNDDNYMRGTLQYFDQYFDIHYVIIFSFPEENPNLNYHFWILDKQGNQQLVKENDQKESLMGKIKENALQEIHINLTQGEGIRLLLDTIRNVVKE